MKITLEGLETEKEIKEEEIFETKQYEENALIDGIWLAYIEAICEWVPVGTEEQYWEEYTKHYQFN